MHAISHFTSDTFPELHHEGGPCLRIVIKITTQATIAFDRIIVSITIGASSAPEDAVPGKDISPVSHRDLARLHKMSAI